VNHLFAIYCHLIDLRLIAKTTKHSNECHLHVKAFMKTIDP